MFRMLKTWTLLLPTPQRALDNYESLGKSSVDLHELGRQWVHWCLLLFDMKAIYGQGPQDLEAEFLYWHNHWNDSSKIQVGWNSGSKAAMAVSSFHSPNDRSHSFLLPKGEASQGCQVCRLLSFRRGSCEILGSYSELLRCAQRWY